MVQYTRSILTVACLVSMLMVYGRPPKIKITILPNQQGLLTAIIQKAIDSCGENGGGIVFFPAGNYLTGGLQLKSKVTLLLEQGAIMQGSDQYIHYKMDALIYGENLTDIAIEGKGTIDGVDCTNANGEEGFRGPHCIRLVYCKNISIKGITIKNSGNWAINCRHCSSAMIENIAIRGGHDGLHTRFCNQFTVTGCDFRTGDDAVAGNDNRDFLISKCKINTSCNGFRFGCYNLTVKQCSLWGPGEYIHKIQNRNNMLAAFVHFSPRDESSQLISGNWLIEDITVENVDHFYIYNYAKGLWQTGQPVSNLRFKNIKATGLLGAFHIVGDTARKFNLSILNSSFTSRKGLTSMYDSFEGAKMHSATFFNASNFNRINLKKVEFEKKGTVKILTCNSGNLLILNQIKCITGDSIVPYSIHAVSQVTNDGVVVNTSE